MKYVTNFLNNILQGASISSAPKDPAGPAGGHSQRQEPAPVPNVNQSVAFGSRSSTAGKASVPGGKPAVFDVLSEIIAILIRHSDSIDGGITGEYGVSSVEIHRDYYSLNNKNFRVCPASSSIHA